MYGKCTVAFVLIFIATVDGNAGGAPKLACEDMKPQHGVDPQPGAFPYRVAVSKSNVRQGEKIKITVSGGTEKDFMGFLVQVRNKDEPVGAFDISDNDKLAQILPCYNKNVAATHKSKDIKDSVDLMWVAPKEFVGKLTVYATVAKNGGRFWARHPTAEIIVN